MSNRFKFRVWDGYGNFLYSDKCDSLSSFFELSEGLDKGKLQQFTGLLDKNNKEIYEGDILNIFDFRVSKQPINKVVIKWLDGGLHAFQNLKDEYPIEEGYTINHEIGNTHEFSETIGNVFENPELLNV